MAANILGELLDGGVAPCGFFPQGLENNVVQVSDQGPAEFVAFQVSIPLIYCPSGGIDFD